MIKLTDSLEVAWNVVTLVMGKSVGQDNMVGFITPYDNGAENGFSIHSTIYDSEAYSGVILRNVTVCKSIIDDSIKVGYMEGVDSGAYVRKVITFPEGAYGEASEWIINYLESGGDSAGVLVEA